MTKAKSQRPRSKAVKHAGSKEVVEKKSDKQLSLRSEDLLGNTAKIMRLPRQMIRVQRSEPSEGIIRNELRYVSYSAKDDSGKNPAEIHVVSEAFSALLSRLRELNIILPEVEDNASRFGIDKGAGNEEVCTLRQKLSASEEECERLRKNIEEIRNAFEYESDRTSVTSLAEPEWVKETEAKIKAVSEELQPIHLQAQRFAPKIFYLKAHLRQILDEIQDRRLKGQLHDDRIREQINSKIHLCTRLASEAIQKNCNN